MFDNFGEILLRKPLFTYDFLFDYNGKSINQNELLDKFLSNSKFLESIFWSSPSFYKIILDYKNGKVLDEKKKKKISLSLKKYIIRSATRPTPFGTFSGISIRDIHFAELNSHQVNKRKLRIDLSILGKIIKALENNNVLKNYIQYHINNTLYTKDDEYRFYEIKNDLENIIQVSSLEKTKILDEVISYIKTDKINFQVLFTMFEDRFEKEELFSFFEQLIEMKFLVSDLEVEFKSNDNFFLLKNNLKNIGLYESEIVAPYLDLIEQIEEYIYKVENAQIGEFFFDYYQDLVLKFENIGININNEQIFQVDLIHNGFDNFLFTKKDLKKINESILLLGNLLSQNKNVTIDSFIKIFSEKYESKPVSLLEVLDVDFGIGFPANESIGSIESTFFSSEEDENLIKNQNANFSDWLVNEIESNLWDDKIDFSNTFGRNFNEISQKLPNTFYVVGQILNDGQILIQNVGGISGNTILSRFTYLDEKIESLCNRIASFEINSSPDVLFADIIWMDNHKMGNISRGVIPKIKYQIPIFYNSSANNEFSIPLEDLFVSIDKGEIILTSKKLNKRIIPRLHSAHNFYLSKNPIYKFLCSIQNQSKYKLDFDPGLNKSFRRFLPRIFYKNIILLPAHWIIHKADIIAENTKFLKIYFKKWNVCQFVLLVQGDNELFIDTNNDAYLEILIDEIKKNDRIILKESLIDPSKRDIYINQFVLPLRKKNPIPLKGLKKNVFGETTINREFFPGSEWLYFKIYCSTNVSNEILIEIYDEIISDLIKQEVIDKWFFIRYYDPHHHIRLRLHKVLKKDFDINFLLQSTLKKYIKNGMIWKINLDTYQREIERYGEKNMQNSETFFYHDSELFLYALRNYGLSDEILNFGLALKNINSLISYLDIDVVEKRTICESMKKKLANEKSKQFLLDIENKYRKHKDNLFDFIDGEEAYFPSFQIIKKNKGLQIKRENIFDYIHMSINRWFPSNQRDWEYFAYYFMHKYYSQTHYLTKAY